MLAIGQHDGNQFEIISLVHISIEFYDDRLNGDAINSIPDEDVSVFNDQSMDPLIDSVAGIHTATHRHRSRLRLQPRLTNESIMLPGGRPAEAPRVAHLIG